MKLTPEFFSDSVSPAFLIRVGAAMEYSGSGEEEEEEEEEGKSETPACPAPAPAANCPTCPPPTPWVDQLPFPKGLLPHFVLGHLATSKSFLILRILHCGMEMFFLFLHWL